MLGFSNHALGQDGPYIQMGLGIAVAPAMDVTGTDNDWGTKCDRIINPNGLEVTDECDTEPAPTEWENAFGGGSGIGSGLALGYRWGAFRIEGEYFHRSTTYDERSAIAIFDDITLDKQEQEIELAIGGVDNLLSHTLFANAYYDVGLGPALVSYGGIGVGVASTSLYYFTHWKRNDDPSRIRTFADPDLNAKIAGSTTVGQARLTDRRLGYQLLAGAAYQIGDHTALDFKGRWVTSSGFKSEKTAWDQLRSHDATVGRGEPILYTITTDDTSFWGVGLSLLYQF